MKMTLKAGQTSNILQIFIRDSSSTTGGGLTGLVFNSSGLTAYYHRDTDTTATAISLVTMTVGTFTSSGFKEIDASNMPGWYQFCPPNAAVAASAGSCAFHLKGVTNMAPTPFEVQLVAYNPQDGVGLGLSGVTIATSQIQAKKNVQLSNFMFPMFDSLGALKSGLTITAQRAIDGGSMASCANAATEIGSTGVYKITLANTDLNGNTIALLFTGSGALPTVYSFPTQA